MEYGRSRNQKFNSRVPVTNALAKVSLLRKSPVDLRRKLVVPR